MSISEVAQLYTRMPRPFLWLFELAYQKELDQHFVQCLFAVGKSARVEA